jgi:hypothetical protein
VRVVGTDRNGCLIVDKEEPVESPPLEARFDKKVDSNQKYYFFRKNVFFAIVTFKYNILIWM